MLQKVRPKVIVLWVFSVWKIAYCFPFIIIYKLPRLKVYIMEIANKIEDATLVFNRQKGFYRISWISIKSKVTVQMGMCMCVWTYTKRTVWAKHKSQAIVSTF